MNAHSVATLAVRMLGLWLWVAGLFFLASAFPGPGANGLWLPLSVSLLLGSVLFFGGSAIASMILPRGAIESDEPVVAQDFPRIAYSVLGLWFIVQGLVRAAQLPTQLPNLVLIAIGISLFLGRPGLLGLSKRYRRLGIESTPEPAVTPSRPQALAISTLGIYLLTSGIVGITWILPSLGDSRAAWTPGWQHYLPSLTQLALGALLFRQSTQIALLWQRSQASPPTEPLTH